MFTDDSLLSKTESDVWFGLTVALVLQGYYGILGLISRQDAYGDRMADFWPGPVHGQRPGPDRGVMGF